MTIDLNTPGVGNYFSADGDIWKCTNGNIIGHAILDFYRSFGNSGLCGLTYLGLPLTSEISIEEGRTYQRFERGVVCYDPARTNDNPPGASSSCYLMHIDSGPGQDPRVGQLESEIAQLKAVPGATILNQINGLASQITKLSQVQ